MREADLHERELVKLDLQAAVHVMFKLNSLGNTEMSYELMHDQQ